jgi:hypothetical protein
MFFQQKLSWLLCLASFTFTEAVPNLVARDDACTNGADSRSCWSTGFSTSVNWDDKFPDTGKTVQV